METPVRNRAREAEKAAWSQSPLIFTSPGGNVSAKGRLTRDESEADDKENEADGKRPASVAVPATSIQLPRLSSRFPAQITPLKTSNRQDSAMFPFTPCFDKRPMTTISKCVPKQYAVTPACMPPLSGKKFRRRNIMGELRATDKVELSSCRPKQARKENFMQRQERLYMDWLNFVLKQQLAGTVKVECLLSRDARRSSDAATEMEASLRVLAPVSELRTRILSHSNLSVCEEILSSISLVVKRIDEGKLRMKEGCAVFADVGLRKKAMEVLMSYSVSWLNTGLEIVLGTSSGCTGTVSLESFLEKQFFVHAGVAKEYATNKSVEGLYRHGYLEALGSVILKRLLLLVLAVDKIKCANTLEAKHGIDGLDGGSPLLFLRDSPIKSSKQALHELLMNAMHGEGDLIAHLSTLGYRLHHVQASLADYKFEVTSLMKDLQDGVRLCRLAQLLTDDYSLLTRIHLPATTRKKQSHNCNVALQRLAAAGIPLVDEQGFTITSDDIVDGYLDRTLFLLWNVVLGLQIPRLLDKNALVKELCRTGSYKDYMEMQNQNPLHITSLLLKWTKNICDAYGFSVQDFRTSFKDGQALCYIINFYLPEHLLRESIKVSSSTELHHTIAKHNFALAYGITSKLEFVPDLHIIKLTELGGNCCAWSERNAVFCVAFLCSKLIGSELQAIIRALDGESSSKCEEENRAAICIQAHFRGCVQRSIYKKFLSSSKKIQRVAKGWIIRQHYLKIQGATKIIQQYWRATRARGELKRSRAVIVIQTAYRAHALRRCKLASKLQAMWRGYLARTNLFKQKAAIQKVQQRWRLLLQERRKRAAATVIQAYYRRWTRQRQYTDLIAGVQRIQSAWRGYSARKKSAALQIQKRWRWFTAHRHLLCCIIKIQAFWRGYLARKMFVQQTRALTVVQKLIRGRVARQKFLLDKRNVTLIQALARRRSCRRRFIALRQACFCVQTHFRRFILRRRSYETAKMIQVQARNERSAKVIQTAYKEWRERNSLRKAREEADAQPFSNIISGSVLCDSFHGKKVTSAVTQARVAFVLRIQRWWRKLHMCRRVQAVVRIQCYYRGWKVRIICKRERHAARLLQANWKGYLARKQQSEQLVELRKRIQTSAATVDDNMTLGNRLKEALALLLGSKTVSGILHICATIDLATRHSRYCCERIADAGAISKLSQLIQTTNRSAPHEQVLKHALSILGNLARYVPLARQIIGTPRCLDVVAEQLQMCRNKEEMFFKAMHVLEEVSKAAPEDFLGSAPVISRRLQHVKHLLENKVQVEQRNLERLTPATPLVTKAAAQRKLRDARAQLHGVVLLSKALATGVNSNSQQEETKRRRR